MALSEGGFIVITYILLIWFIVSNLLLACYCFKEWVFGTSKRLKLVHPKNEGK
ncbi:hypothetical protein PP175_04070 [Aneurinibacillus sp. Ricciae_BoGa-3]|uniref:hypothetical protein n=1 Tax=Aneurinibacillus sp. Ricciae_BoGa-3 TaxID=3022697 RepID=UPI0023422B28|nr:hypothetical protein [Aneurinibacillus sp. Ricciae_BoGa-3]WCK55172.1 hypothetical protein PP175_04070 [Aneurinibacillus sp. Ricciae_BoGa-3]